MTALPSPGMFCSQGSAKYVFVAPQKKRLSHLAKSLIQLVGTERFELSTYGLRVPGSKWTFGFIELNYPVLSSINGLS
ncbi:hypothetical protein [Candidatus Aalborgicola defluviihabitans]|uniref:hypothetical protein n=1 Tax=Candidatus Aalborgicola defluviihabitans TaxID=3386187 RepID=UPI001EBBE560|nr:hypothetical protein [Burkholderiales bacterium]